MHINLLFFPENALFQRVGIFFTCPITIIQDDMQITNIVQTIESKRNNKISIHEQAQQYRAANTGGDSVF